MLAALANSLLRAPRKPMETSAVPGGLACTGPRTSAARSPIKRGWVITEARILLIFSP